MAAREHDESIAEQEHHGEHDAATITGGGAFGGAVAGATVGSVAGPVGAAAGAVAGAVVGGIAGGVAAQGMDEAPAADQERPDTRGAAEDPLAAGRPEDRGSRLP